eukprot:TRINITY_DN47221_c0_g1_i1.p1 TRINITY_DN47221_c0_g1~~TRINITY_DN47221_c0_g1_i1.p1  ORF type:complete len:416 (-),score=67.70 TRINITY_DN47221_c0_g1_i1:68-1315(-)
MPWSRGRQPPQAYQSHAGESLLIDGTADSDHADSRPPAEPRAIWRGPVRQTEGLFTTFIHSQDPRNPNASPQRKVASYDFAHLCRWGGVLGFFTRAGVLRASWSLAVCLTSTLGFALLTAVLVSWHNEEHHMDITAMDTLQQRVNIIVTFILGFFVQLSLSRWWNHREYLRQLHGATADILLLLASVGISQEKLRTVARLGLLSQALLFDEVRGAFDFESQQSEEAQSEVPAPVAGPYVGLMRLGLLRAEEVAYLQGKAQKAQMVWAWMASFVCWSMKEDAPSDSTKAFKIQKRCCLGRGAVSAIKAQLGTQLPYTYVQLICMLVQFSHFVMGLGCGYTGAAAYGTGRWALIVSQLAQAILVPLTFQSLLDVCVYVSNPYGSDVVDFSFLQYHVSFLKLCESIISPMPPSLCSSA